MVDCSPEGWAIIFKATSIAADLHVSQLISWVTAPPWSTLSGMCMLLAGQVSNIDGVKTAQTIAN
jgi:hypothetical protein